MIIEFKVFGSRKKTFVDGNNGFILGVFRNYGIWEIFWLALNILKRSGTGIIFYETPTFIVDMDDKFVW